MRTLLFFLSIALLSSCGGGSKQYSKEVQKLDSLLTEVNSVETMFEQLPHAEIKSRLDSISSTISFLEGALGDEIAFEDGMLLDDFRGTKSIVKRFGERTTQMKIEFKRTQAQLQNFKEALSNGADKDKTGEEITEEYVKKNMELETTAAENLISSVKELKERSTRFIKENQAKLEALSPVIERYK